MGPGIRMCILNKASLSLSRGGERPPEDCTASGNRLARPANTRRRPSLCCPTSFIPSPPVVFFAPPEFCPRRPVESCSQLRNWNPHSHSGVTEDHHDHDGGRVPPGAVEEEVAVSPLFQTGTRRHAAFAFSHEPGNPLAHASLAQETPAQSLVRSRPSRPTHTAALAAREKRNHSRPSVDITPTQDRLIQPTSRPRASPVDAPPAHAAPFARTTAARGATVAAHQGLP